MNVIGILTVLFGIYVVSKPEKKMIYAFIGLQAVVCAIRYVNLNSYILKILSLIIQIYSLSHIFAES
jgi:hypothetical protein